MPALTIHATTPMRVHEEDNGRPRSEAVPLLPDPSWCAPSPLVHTTKRVRTSDQMLPAREPRRNDGAGRTITDVMVGLVTEGMTMMIVTHKMGFARPKS